MPVAARITISQADQVRLRKEFAEMVKRVQDWRPFWPVAKAVMHRSVIANFRMGGRPKKWKALSPWTLKVRAAKGALSGNALGQNILMDTGALFQSIGNVDETSRNSFRYGTNLIYARLQNYGTAGLPGGVLRPKKGMYLALPFPGVVGGPRDYKDTFVITTSKSKTIWQKLEGGAKPLFLLKKSVKIPARPFMLYQEKDVDQIISYAKAYVFRPQSFVTIPRNV